MATNWRDRAYVDPMAIDRLLGYVRDDICRAKLATSEAPVPLLLIQQRLARAEGLLSGLIGDVDAEPAAGDRIIAGVEEV
jgi:hypothetical protein